MAQQLVANMPQPALVKLPNSNWSSPPPMCYIWPVRSMKIINFNATYCLTPGSNWQQLTGSGWYSLTFSAAVLNTYGPLLVQFTGDSGRPITTTTAAFAMPAVGAMIEVPVESSSGLCVGQIVYVPSAGYLTVMNPIPDATHVLLGNAPTSTNTANAVPGTVIATGTAIDGVNEIVCVPFNVVLATPDQLADENILLQFFYAPADVPARNVVAGKLSYMTVTRKLPSMKDFSQGVESTIYFYYDEFTMDGKAIQAGPVVTGSSA
jgi:hypothetical protein